MNRQEIARLSDAHGLPPRWHEPWVKSRTAGSDDHGLLNVGRTWTEFPPETSCPQDVLDHLRAGRCRPGGEAGSSAKLAHTFYSVAVRYYTNHIMTSAHSENLATTMLQTLTGQRKLPSKPRLAWLFARHKMKKIGKRLLSPFAPAKEPPGGTRFLKRRFLKSAWARFKDDPEMRAAMEAGLPPLGEHERMFELVSGINRDVTDGLASAIKQSIDDASFTELFDTIGAILAQQFVLLPYYFSVFHQNKERHLLREITRLGQRKQLDTMKVGLFTDTYDEINGVGRFLRDMHAQAQRRDRRLIIHTCADNPSTPETAHRKNFRPLLSRPMPFYPELRLNLPPLLDILEWADRQQFDAIHVSTPGPMGLCGWVVSQMLRVPLLTTYHTDFPQYVDRLSGDHRVTRGTVEYMKWFYAQAATVFSRSNAYQFNLRDLNVPESKLRTIVAGVDQSRFRPIPRSANLPGDRNKRLLYCGRVSVEKNLPLLTEIFRRIVAVHNDVSLIVAGDGPYRETMQNELRHLPAHFLGACDDAKLRELYSGCDLLVFPSRTDTLGQVVMESQACGLPAIVTNEGGPKEIIEHNSTGLVIGSSEPDAWREAIVLLLSDEPRRMRMSLAAVARSARFSVENTFENFWADHLAVVEPVDVQPAVVAPAPSAVRV
jgi:glycosyltransferase involved in cell wall biosynthesis